MLAAARFRLLAGFLTVFVLSVSAYSFGQSPVLPGQFQGVPATPFQGVPAAPSLNTYRASPGATNVPIGCCANFFLPSGFSPMNPLPVLTVEHRHRRRHKDERNDAGVEPVYVPYVVPYAVNADDDTAEDQDAPESGSTGTVRRRAPGRNFPAGGSGNDNDGADDSDAASNLGYDYQRPWTPPEEKPEEPVVVQPTTVLVFKDGHRASVVNYAIVGDTLFDFAEDHVRKILLADLDLPATRKANDDLGVEFKVPPGS
jgi:hypothetical protein